MKFKKNYPKVNILEHGKEYISPDFAPICPECGSENCRLALNFGRGTSGSWGHTGAIYSTRIYYKEYVCRGCECRFRIDEGRKVEIDWWVIFAILVSVLVAAFGIAVVVIGSE